ncbi:MAG TPA: hypothetical protein VGI10_28195 [Polyangiaceae bacterium]
MSAHETAPNAAHDAEHDTHDEDVFPADEPHSPAWLPLLGGALFLSAALLWVALALPSPSPSPGENPTAAAAAPAPTPAARPPAAPAPPGGAAVQR